MRREAAPTDGTGEAKIVENFRIIVCHAARENLALPCVRWRFVTLQLPQRFERAAFTEKLRRGGNVLPAEQPAHELRRGDGLNFVAQPAEGLAMDSREQAAVAPFCFARCPIANRVGKLPAEHGAARFESQQRLVDFVRRDAEQFAELARANWAGMLHPTSDERENGVVF